MNVVMLEVLKGQRKQYNKAKQSGYIARTAPIKSVFFL